MALGENCSSNDWREISAKGFISNSHAQIQMQTENTATWNIKKMEYTVCEWLVRLVQVRKREMNLLCIFISCGTVSICSLLLPEYRFNFTNRLRQQQQQQSLQHQQQRPSPFV